MKMAIFPRRGICLALTFIFSSTCLTPGVDARQRYSTIQGNIREEAEIEPYEGGKKAGPVQDWELLCKIEGDAELKATVIKEAEEGKLDQIFVLACMNLQGKGVPKNLTAAFELFKACANKGHSSSQNNLGFMFEEGVGTKKDLKQAMTWYQTAADYNNPNGLCNLGNMIEHGRGVPANPEQAYTLYQKASELGSKVARQNVIGYEFERDRKWKLKGIEVNQTATDAAKQTLSYNPTAALFKNSAPPSSAKAVNALAPAEAKVAVATKPAPPAVAKQETKTTPTTDVVANVISKLKAADKANTDKVAADKTSVKTADKAKSAASSPTESKAKEKKQDVPAVATEQEATPAEVQSGLQAGTPTLTAILNRLSKGTSLEQEQPAASSTAETTKDEKPQVALAPKAAPTEAKVESKVAAKPDKADAKADKKADAKEKKDDARVEKKAKADAKAAEKLAKSAEKQVDKKPEPKPSATEKPVVAAVERPVEATAEKTSASAEKPAAKQDETAVEVKKSALDTPISYKAPAKPEVKPEPAATTAKPEVKTAAKPESKPTGKPEVKTAPAAKTAAKPETKPVVAAKLPAATTGSADPKVKEFNKLAEKSANRPIRDKWALVIGITDFQDPDIPDLQYSAKDATDFYNYLVKEANFQPDHVRLLLNEQATQRRVLSELGSKFLARVVKPDDLVVLYFSTHGSPSQLDPRGKNYLVASDSDSADLFATGIEMQKLLDSIQGRVLTDRVLLVMDACHSGFAAPDSKGMSRLGNFKAEDLAQGSGQLVICSSMPEERAWESTRYQNGVFTRKLLDGLRAKGTGTSLVEAFTAARSAVGNEVQEDRPGAKQTPVLKGKWDGNDLVLATPAYAPQAIPNSVAQNLETDSRVDLIASASRPQGIRNVSEDKDTEGVTKPTNDSAPRSGVLYLDSQFFSVPGDPKAVAKDYGDAIRSNGTDSELYFLRAKAFIQLGDWHQAMTSLTDAIQLSPNRAQYYLGRAYVNFRLGKKVLAEQDLEQARFHDHKLTNNIRFHM
ncbi:caspase family protein [Candidatus Obscuribacterales bacterium]|nr:caspase family protein [Candidatus Obscuribacterales bacterium]MBX3151265.1 caspase family protein [Candidatus Obscuribacterales bacterium]